MLHSSISQKAAYAALTEDNVYTLGMNAAFKKRRDLMVKYLENIPGLITNIPQGAFYAFPDASSYFGRSDTYISIKNSSDLSMYLLNEAHVATVPGIAFGNPECIRFSYAASTSNIHKAMVRIKTALDRIR